MPYLNIQFIKNNSITIYRRVKTPDTFGGFTVTENKIAWSVACRIYGRSGYIKITIQGKEYAVTNKMMVARNLDIKVLDKIVESNNNEVYFVVDVKPVYNLKDISHKEVYLSKIEGSLEA